MFFRAKGVQFKIRVYLREFWPPMQRRDLGRSVLSGSENPKRDCGAIVLIDWFSLSSWIVQSHSPYLGWTVRSLPLGVRRGIGCGGR